MHLMNVHFWAYLLADWCDCGEPTKGMGKECFPARLTQLTSGSAARTLDEHVDNTTSNGAQLSFFPLVLHGSHGVVELLSSSYQATQYCFPISCRGGSDMSFARENFASWKADPDYAGYGVEHFKKLCGVPLDGNVPPRPKRLGLLPGQF